MRTHSRFFWLTATTAIVGLAVGTLPSRAAFAQSPLPPLLGAPSAAPAQVPQTTADPPARVGRVAAVTGQLSFHAAGADHWDTAGLNFPVTSGDSFWTQPGGSADIGITNNRVTMDQSTELNVATLDDRSFSATIPQGQIFLRLWALAPGETYTITTPRGVVAIAAPGAYAVAAGDVQTPTRISVVEGQAQVSGGNAQGSGTITVAADQTLVITGTDQFEPQLGPLQRDAFLTAQLARERPQVATGAAAPPEVAQMTGGDDLYQYGTWTQTPDYGDVWYPQVAAGYVPYRDGQWVFVQPWGWTWVDAAPWGFAPFHYGRWVQVNGRWGWAPGGGVAVGSPGYYRPVYAPALVTFFGIGAGAAAGIALAGGTVGWCPLGWQEPYHPWYHVSPNYVRNVNIGSVRNVAGITTARNVTIDSFANRGAATMVPARAMALSQPIGREARPFPEAQFADARPLVGRDPIAPTTATIGVTPRVARDLHVGPPPPGEGPPLRAAAPGPSVRAYANVRPEPVPNATLPPRAPAAVQHVEAPHVATLGPPPSLPPVYQPTRPYEPPHVVEQAHPPAVPTSLPRVYEPTHSYEPPHAVPQFRPPQPSSPPHVVEQFRPPAPQSRPAAPPPPHGQERREPS